MLRALLTQLQADASPAHALTEDEGQARAALVQLLLTYELEVRHPGPSYMCQPSLLVLLPKTFPSRSTYIVSWPLREQHYT